jgi:hypothetical protein
MAFKNIISNLYSPPPPFPQTTGRLRKLPEPCPFILGLFDVDERDGLIIALSD